MSGIDLAAECWPIRYIEPASDGTFEPSEGGVLAALLPVENDDEIVDVIAWELAGTGSPWWQRTGAATHLGEFWRQRALMSGRPLRLVASPKAWLEDRGEALCVLDWSANLASILGGLDLVATSPGLEQAVRRRLAEQQHDAVHFIGGAAA